MTLFRPQRLYSRFVLLSNCHQFQHYGFNGLWFTALTLAPFPLALCSLSDDWHFSTKLTQILRELEIFVYKMVPFFNRDSFKFRELSLAKQRLAKMEEIMQKIAEARQSGRSLTEVLSPENMAILNEARVSFIWLNFPG